MYLQKGLTMTAIISIAAILVAIAAAAQQGVLFDHENSLIEAMPDLR